MGLLEKAQLKKQKQNTKAETIDSPIDESQVINNDQILEKLQIEEKEQTNTTPSLLEKARQKKISIHANRYLHTMIRYHQYVNNHRQNYCNPSPHL